MTRNSGLIAGLLVVGVVFCSPFTLAGDLDDLIDTSPGTAKNASLPTTLQQPKSLSRQLQLDQKSSDPKIRKAAASKQVSATLSLDFASGDPGRIDEAMQVLRESMKHNGGWCRANLEGRWLGPLLAVKQYDLIRDVINEGFSDPSQYNDTMGVASTQSALVQLLLATGKCDEALVAAKGYYNVAKLPDTGKAIGLVGEALANTRLEQDKDVVRRFRMQQEAGAQIATNTPPPAQWGDLGENILHTIKIDPSQYEATINAISQAPKSFASLTAKGNLLLLADRADEASEAFKLSLDLAVSPAEVQAAVANVARSIRAKTGMIGPANAYIVSVRQGNDKESTEIP